MRRVAGFSLLEVLAALALLAILLLVVYSGVRMASLSVQRGSAVIDRLDEIRGAREFVRREVAEAVALPWILDTKGRPVVFEGTREKIRFVAPLPGYLGTTGMQVVNIRLVQDDDGHAQRIEAFFAPLPTSAAALPDMAPEPLVGGLHALRFRFAGSDGVWKGQWDDRASLPVLVGIEAEDGKTAAWPDLVVAPRQSASALNPAAIGRTLRREDAL